jgi:hypothetical protein
MALDIVTQESIIDETAGLSDDDVNSATARTTTARCHTCSAAMPPVG